MRLVDLDGSGGNQDRALDSQAVVPSGVVNIVKEVFTPPADGNASTVIFYFTATPNFGMTAFSLIDDNAGPGNDTQQSMPITSFGAADAIYVTETANPNWSLANLNCVEDRTQDSTKLSLNPTATIIVQSGETVTCTYSNSQLVPTAAPATIAGRVTDQTGRGIGKAYITVTALPSGEVVTARTNIFGFYQVPDLETGRSYMVNVQAKGFVFEPDSRFVSLTDDLAGLDFFAAPQ
jgi:hypothetical protein